MAKGQAPTPTPIASPPSELAKCCCHKPESADSRRRTVAENQTKLIQLMSKCQYSLGYTPTQVGSNQASEPRDSQYRYRLCLAAAVAIAVDW